MSLTTNAFPEKPKEKTKLIDNQMPTRYTINETKKEYFDMRAFMKSKNTSDEAMYKYNPLWILTTEGGDGEMSGRWIGDAITGSDVKPGDLASVDISPLMVNPRIERVYK